MAGRFKGFCHFPCFQTLPPSRAPQARGEACVTVFERRSHLGPPAEGRQGPSDDDDDDDDIYIMVKCVCVCHKSHYFCIQRICPFLLFLDTFRIQDIWSFLLFLDTFNTKSV